MSEVKTELEQIKKFAVHYKKYLLFLLVLIPLFFAIFFRVIPASMPLTDSWAEQSVRGQISQNVAQQVNAQFPTLPDAQKEAYVNQQVSELMEQNQESVAAQISATSQAFKDRLQDDQGQTYLLAIDPYYYAHYARSYIETGSVGDEERNGSAYDSKAIAPTGRLADTNYHVYASAWFYKFTTLFGNDNYLRAFFYMPVIVSALAVLICFLLVKQFFGAIPATISSTLLGVHSAFLSRTVGGFSDTDPYNVFFPLLIVWLVVLGLSLKDWKFKIGLAMLAGIVVGIYSRFWAGWWYIFDILLVSGAIYITFLLIKNWKEKQFETAKKTAIQGLTFFFSSLFFLGVFSSSNFYYGVLGGIKALLSVPLSVIALKEVGKSSIWPNVFTTVAELNLASINDTIGILGGIIIVLISFIGIIYALLKKSGTSRFAGIVFATWMIVAFYATKTAGVRFTLILVPAFSIGVGLFFYMLKDYGEEKIAKSLNLPKIAISVCIILLAVLLLVTPISAGYDQATNEIPSMNDAWWNTLENIKANSAEDAIITSWWDFGHWFKYVADRGVTFDGASQNRPQAHWVGKILQTNNETEALNLLSAMNCGGQQAYKKIESASLKQLDAVRVYEAIIDLSEEDAKAYLEERGYDPSITSQTHCEKREAYLIASEDMIGKTPVWSHFGSWDFEKAAMVQVVKNNPAEKAKEELQSRFNLTTQQASNLYNEISNADANQWIAPWPQYYSRPSSCTPHENNTASCMTRVSGNPVQVTLDLSTKEATISGNSIGKASFIEGNELIVKETKNSTLPVGALINLNEATPTILLGDLQVSDSIFSRMFFENGEGLKCFELFDRQNIVVGGGQIYVYKVDWSCQ